MKKLNLLFQLSTITSLLVAGFVTFAMAQNADDRAKDQKLTIDIEVTENGETKKITKELDAIEGEDIESILKNLDVLDDIDIRGTGERIEIKVKKEVDGEDIGDKRVRVKVFGDEDEFHWQGNNVARESRPLLGVFIEDYDGDDASGALVKKIIEGSAAEKAGILKNDVITRVGTTTIKDEEHLREVIAGKEVGEEVEVVFLRNGSEMTKTVELGESKEEGFDLNNFHFDFDANGFDEAMKKLEDMDIDIDFDFDFEFDEDAAFLGVTPGERNNEGVSLGKVINGSSAQKMGLEAGDVITSLDGKKVESFDDLAEAISKKKAGDKIAIGYLRNGKLNKVKGELGKRDGQVFEKHIIHSGVNGNPDVDVFWSPETEIVKEVKVVIELKDATKEEEALLAEPADVNFAKSLALNKIEFAPNPSDGNFSLAFELPEKKDTRVMVFDQMGRKVYEELLMNFDGSYRNQIDISSQPSGVYFLIIAQQEKQFTRKIVKN